MHCCTLRQNQPKRNKKTNCYFANITLQRDNYYIYIDGICFHSKFYCTLFTNHAKFDLKMDNLCFVTHFGG